MKKPLQSLLVAAISAGLVHPVYADDPNSTSPHPPVIMKVDGVEGTWFRADSVKKFLQLDTDYSTCKELVAKKDELIKLQLSEIDLTIQLKDNAREMAKLRGDQLGLEVTRRIEAEKSRDSWYRSPILWFTLGVATSVAVVIAVK